MLSYFRYTRLRLHESVAKSCLKNRSLAPHKKRREGVHACELSRHIAQIMMLNWCLARVRGSSGHTTETSTFSTSSHLR